MTGRVIELAVYGSPAPQGSKRAFMGKRKDGSAYQGVIESSHDRVKSWRQAVLEEAVKVADVDGREPLDGPLAVSMVFSLRRPKSHYRTGRNAHLLKDSSPVRPCGTPDLSKLARSTEDALTQAGIWRDDALVAEYFRLAKVWCSNDPDALIVPGARIRIWAVADARTTLAFELAAIAGLSAGTAGTGEPP